MTSTDLSVAIVGAGIAGLAAAEKLIASGCRVTVIEARDAIGGRIRTDRRFGGSPIERGAEFVHGRHPGLVRRIERAGLHLAERRFEPVMLDAGRRLEQPTSWDRVFSELANPDAPDVPIAVRARELLACGAWNEADARRLRRYVEGYMAADVDRISARAIADETRAGEAIGEDGNATIREGYDALVRHMAGALDDPRATLVLGAAVTRIAWSRGTATLHVQARSPAALKCVRADRAVVTIPLSLLQATPLDGRADETVRSGEAIVFEPAVAAIVTAARRLAMGNVVKLFLQARAPLAALPGLAPALAGELSSCRFLQTPAGHVPTWWRAGTDEKPILVGWTGGAAADRLSGRSEDEIVATGFDTLARALAVPVETLRSFFDAATASDWKSEPWARGAYSWIPAGALDAPRVLATPVDGTLFFAGEATDLAGYRGTVHGALVTGLRAADQVLASAL